MAIPILKPNSSWFIPTISTITRSTITTINIVDSYTPSTTPTNSWDASVAQDGSIMCYVEGTVLTIAGNGSGKIMANADSSYAFSHATDFYKALTVINGLNLLDTSFCTNMSYMFFKAYKLTSLDLSGFNTSNVTDMTYMLGSDSSSYPMGLTSIIFGENFNTSNVQSFGRMFQRCNKITEIDVAGFDTSSATALNHMFNGCNALTTLDVSNWNTSKNTSCRCMFQNCNVLTKLNVSNWDTSKVTDMYYMFTKCYALSDCDPSGFDTSSCTTMQCMFSECQSIPNFSVAGWDVSKVTNMGFMFYDCENLTALDFENWDVSNVIVFDHFLAHSINLANFDVSKWKINSGCTHFSCMFHSTAVNYLDVSGFNTSGAISMFSMFEAMRNLEKIDGLQNFDTSNCHAFEEMFSGCYVLKELDLSSWDTRKADIDTKARSDSNNYTSQCTKNMFASCRSLEKITLGANFTFAGDGTASATYHGSLPTPSNAYITNADGNWHAETGEVYVAANIPSLSANVYYAYPVSVLMKGSDFKATIPNTATSVIFTETAPSASVTLTNVGAGGNSSVVAWLDGTTYYVYCQSRGKYLANTDCSYMFSGKTALTSIDTGNLDTSSTTNMEYMFGHTAAMNLTSITFGSNFNTSNVTNMFAMFRYCNVLPSIDVTNFDTSSCTTIGRMFDQCRKLTTVGDLTNWDTSKVVDMSIMFQYNRALTNIGSVANWNTSNVTDMRYMFSWCMSLPYVDVSNWDTSKVRDMEGLFQDCQIMTSIDVSNWDTSACEDMQYMFNHCFALKSVDVSNFNTENVTSMFAMFNQCLELEEIDASNFKTGKVTNFRMLFQYNKKMQKFSVKNWDTSSCENMSFMFYECTQWDSIDFEDWDVRKVKTFDHFMAHANIANFDVSKWQITSACTSLGAMFHQADETVIDVSGWDTSNVTCFAQMFDGNYYLEKVIGLETWDTSKGLDFMEMFGGCSKLKELDLSSFDTRKAKVGTIINTGTNAKGKGLKSMISGCSSLEKITFGSNFSFNGDGSLTGNNRAILPTPSSANIEGADGNWYTIDGAAYAPANIPNLTYNIYYSSLNKIDNLTVVITNGVLRSIANAIRAKNGSNSKYYPNDFAAEILKL